METVNILTMQEIQEMSRIIIKAKHG